MGQTQDKHPGLHLLPDMFQTRSKLPAFIDGCLIVRALRQYQLRTIKANLVMSVKAMSLS